MNRNVIIEDEMATPLPEELVMEPEGFIAAAVALFFIGFFGFFFNLMVIILMIREKQLWTPLNVILFNLVCSDFSISMLGNPVTFTATVYRTWIFGRTMCVIYGFYMSLLGIASITTLTVLAFERYVMISRPFRKSNLNKSGAVRLLVFIWMYSLCLTVPPLVGWGEYVNESANISCSVNWESRTYNATTYIVFLFAFGLVLPVGIITFSYFNIISTMKKNTLRSGSVTKAETKVALMIAVMIVAFLIAWTPYAILSLIIAFGDHHLVTPGLAVVPALVAKSSICYNPLIYVGLNTQFRSAWQRFLGVQVADESSQNVVGDQLTTTRTNTCQAKHDISVTDKPKRNLRFLSFFAKPPSNSFSLSTSISVTHITTVGTSPEIVRNSNRLSPVTNSKETEEPKNFTEEENELQCFKMLTKFPKNWEEKRRILRIRDANPVSEEKQLVPNVKVDIYQDVSEVHEMDALASDHRVNIQ